jgi:hypothetical protein
MPNFQTFREFLRDSVPDWLSGDLSGPFVQTVLGVAADTYAQGMAIAHRMGWLLDEESPNDTLPLFAIERRMPRYPSETPANHRARLHGAWDTYARAGSKAVIREQLAAMGFETVVILDAWELPLLNPSGGWSQFWIFFPAGTHPVTGQGPSIGSFDVGDGTTIGPLGLTPGQLKAMRALVRKWKPSQWVGRQFRFVISGWTIGDGSVIGDPGLEIGGEQAVVGI